jgi:prepilin-type processing-associated H-X9-DG protein
MLVLVVLSLAVIQQARDYAQRMNCANNLRQIGLALHLYHDSYGSLPPGVFAADKNSPYGLRMTWNVLLLPYLDQLSLWKTSAAAYVTDPDPFHNPPHLGMNTVLGVYQCPADPRSGTTRVVSGTEVAYTSYLGVQGTDTFNQDGVLYCASQTRFADILDGTSTTVAAGERPSSPDGVLGWWYAAGSPSRDGTAQVVLGVREIDTIFVGCPVGPYEFSAGDPANICDAFHFWSGHRGGANFLFADGSVRFLAYSANSVLPALATRAGGEAIADQGY